MTEFKRNGIEHSILANLAREDYPANTIAKKLKVKSVNGEMFELARKGYVRQVGINYFTLTNEGLDAYHELGAIHENMPRRSSGREWMIEGSYDGADLRDSNLRPGAFDYRKHPSLKSGERVWLGRGNYVIKTESLPRH